jgi:flagellar biosynthesis/type III secretory pathway M-ring protein FliF/YscJ
MEALLEILQAILKVIIEVTIHALVFIYLLLRSIFSPHYRQKLKQHWDTSFWQRFSIVIGICLYSVALLIALVFWIPLLFQSAEPKTNGGDRDEEAIEIEFTKEEVEQLKKTKEIKELAEKAGEFIKGKLEERKRQKSGESEAR